MCSAVLAKTNPRGKPYEAKIGKATSNSTDEIDNLGGAQPSSLDSTLN